MNIVYTMYYYNVYVYDAVGKGFAVVMFIKKDDALYYFAFIILRVTVNCC